MNEPAAQDEMGKIFLISFDFFGEREREREREREPIRKSSSFATSVD